MPDRMSHDEMAVRLAQLEARQKQDEEEIKPLLDLYNAGRIVGRIVFFIGGAIIGVITFWKAVGDWIVSHIK